MFSKQGVIELPKHFVEYVISIIDSIFVLFIKDDELDLQSYCECRENSKSVFNTLQIYLN